ncbi:hypothetical protein PEC18_05070 [Paucibacter sp. O1-1]|uniref:hypothetical protein n=1 Tax=Aquabacterium sp. OR-4 TaxID=2978127 RepID=UPI0021B1C306|nr:hypothetical protein [Aquabacterium sp. OR-4]MCU7370256.1 hypothetical protein [Paucibacter sp. O1-1]MDA3825241.1 hypothetical protein [Paucibacter sp. O1-1]MDT7836481.1 hypothetical protein [Aquabacterium sp. OR-4]
MNLSTLDAAVSAHMAHGAMALDAPLTTALCDQFCAPEGAQPAVAAGAGLTPTQQAALAEADSDPWLWRLAPLAVLLGLCTGARAAGDVLGIARDWLA